MVLMHHFIRFTIPFGRSGFQFFGVLLDFFLFAFVAGDFIAVFLHIDTRQDGG